MHRLAVVLVLSMVGVSAAAQEYAGMQERPIKALSEEQVTGFLSGAGMGFATAAELNGYPGPRHVLELATELDLDASQAERIRAIQEAMKLEAQTLGKQLVAAERALDSLLGSGGADEEAVKSAIERAGAIEAALRFAHIRAHLETAPVLSAAQRARYAQLRGYSDGETHHHKHGH